MTRDCSVCGIEKEMTDYPKNGKDKQGNTRHRTDCKECYGITRRLTKRKSVTKFLNNTKHRTGEIDTYTLDDWRDAMLHFRGACCYCGAKQSRRLRLTRDHVIPVSKGGGTTRKSIVPACQSCNSSKANKDMITWFKTKQFFDMGRLAEIITWCGGDV
jgi:5-methylcytosine-specific restriction endonuclease McrA